MNLQSQQQLQTVVNDLAVLRRNVEQLSNKHEQMSRDIATVQATEQNISEKIFVYSARVRARAHPAAKKIPRLARAETQGNQLRCPSRRRLQLPERHRLPSSRLVRLCHCQPPLKHRRPSINIACRA
jgi:hypothetical protein